MSARARFETVWEERLLALTSALGGSVTGDDLPEALSTSVDLTSSRAVWAVLYALSARIPSEHDVQETLRRAEFHGGAAVVATLRRLTTRRSAARTVSFSRDRVLVDVGHTAEVEFRTGIQRVAVETGVRWHQEQDCDLIGWTRAMDGLRLLGADEIRLLHERLPGPGERRGELPGPVEDVVVPLSGTYLSPELTLGKDSFLSLARYAGLRTGVIGFDCVCLTSAETVAPGMAAAFGRYLAAVRYVDRVATISHAAAAEYSGWAGMLVSTGLSGPTVVAVPLTDEMSVAPDLELADQLFAVGRMPRVLVVGSHEPRKNHLAVLAAAETLWDEGLEFSLSFVGGRSWGNDHFHTTLQRLQDEGRPVAPVTGVPDAGLAGGYASARFTMFPSLNEGFGLPVAESLAYGTPVITSDFGSMKEIAAGGGALLVDPRDDDDVTGAMRRLLVDDDLVERLRAEARARPVRTWDTYAEETWQVLTGGGP